LQLPSFGANFKTSGFEISTKLIGCIRPQQTLAQTIEKSGNCIDPARGGGRPGADVRLSFEITLWYFQLIPI
jgi:hypothetical protein